MKARAVAALAAIFVAPWLAANDHSIGRISDPKQRQAQRAVFTQTVAELHRQERVAAPSAGDARALAGRILADHKRFSFGAVQKAPPKTWWERLQDWLAERWKAIVKGLFGKAHLSRSSSIAIGDVLLGLSILAFFALLIRLLLQYGRRSALPGAQTHTLDREQSANSLAAQAQRAADAGDFNRAAALLFAASLHVLAGRGDVEMDTGRTVGQLSRLVRASVPAAAAAFDTMGAMLTKSVYAEEPLTRAEWEDALAAYRALERIEAARAA